MSNQKIENNSSEAPLPTPSEIGETEEFKSNNFTKCPDCGSSIEILSIYENRIEYRCLNEKNEHIEETKFTKTIEEYLKNIIRNKDNKIDKCHIENHNLNNYVGYCLDCKFHLCDECLKTKEHINHRKSYMVEIQPIEEEIKLIKEVIVDLRKKKKNLEDEEKEKVEEINKSLNKEMEEEKKVYKRTKDDNGKKKEEELKENKNIYLNDIENIKKEYEEKLKIRKNQYLKDNEKIIAEFKLIDEKLNTEFELKKKKLNESSDLVKLNLGFMDKIKNTENMLKLNEIIYNTYDKYKSNYYNSMSINNLLLYYNDNEEINNKMRDILGNKYDKIINIRKKKFNEDIEMQLTKELNKTKKENEELDKKNKELENRLNNILEEKKKKMNEILNGKNNELKELELKLKDYEIKNNNLELEIKNMKDKNNILENEKKKFDKIKAKNEELNKKYNEIKERLSTAPQQNVIIF